MAPLIALIIPAIVLIVVALIIIWVTERFSPDPLVTKIVRVIVFACVLIWCVLKLFPLLL